MKKFALLPFLLFIGHSGLYAQHNYAPKKNISSTVDHFIPEKQEPLSKGKYVIEFSLSEYGINTGLKVEFTVGHP